MSDKAEHLISKYLNEKMGISFGSLTVYDHTTVKKLVDFSIEKHLEDVLAEVEKEIEHKREMSHKDGYDNGFIDGMEQVLNLLKQRKG